MHWRLGVQWSIVGSLASSTHGVARSTLDVDLVVDPGLDDVNALVRRLGQEYYIDADSAADAIRHRTMFNLVHLATMLTIDLYVLPDREYGRASFARRRREQIFQTQPASRVFEYTPEDTLLHKLEWYEAGGRVSERQWGNVVGLLKVQAAAIDSSYLRDWASRLQIGDLLEAAIREAAE